MKLFHRWHHPEQKGMIELMVSSCLHCRVIGDDRYCRFLEKQAAITLRVAMIRARMYTREERWPTSIASRATGKTLRHNGHG